MVKKQKKQVKNLPTLDRLANQATVWIGSTASIILHTILFTIAFLLILTGIPADTVLLVLTTIVSLEAIYISIFIQRSVNLQNETLAGEFDQLEEAISEDIDQTEAALMRDLDETERNISEDIDQTEAEISKDIDETERGIVKKTPKVLEQPMDEIVSEIQKVVREELKQALQEVKNQK